MKKSLLLLVALCVLTANSAENQKATSAPQPYVVGISPFLEKAVKDDVYRSVVRLLVEDLPLNKIGRAHV